MTAKNSPGAEQFKLNTAPHVRAEQSTPQIMYSVILTLMPASFCGIYFFGLRALYIILLCVGAALATEALFLWLRGKKISLFDGSAALTGLLLALCLPVKIPLTLAGLGAVIAIALGKQIFGGLGDNIFNPALVGRAFLQASFPVWMTSWVKPFYYESHTVFADAVTTATPLARMKFDHQFVPYQKLLYGNIGGSIGETSALALLAGGLFLLVMQNIDWRIPTGYLGTVALLGGLFHLANPQIYPDPLSHLLAGGLLLGAFFMATDMVTSPVSPLGSWIFACGAGVLVVIIRLFGGLPEGVMYSILLMNALTPLIDRYTWPKMFAEENIHQ